MVHKEPLSGLGTIKKSSITQVNLLGASSQNTHEVSLNAQSVTDLHELARDTPQKDKIQPLSGPSAKPTRK